ncbi:YicC family protein [Enterococcus villorum]|uniref:YicC family protein n=1 Tax=Enterococcus villorum TaxID=112904 RepID=A0A1V8Y9P9_9ENTE|nr:YicC/YloC family endoribonuclease [Enterococcus villorum]OQO69026.1 YicC family protein [Enterococcus villorum]OQO76119.1 YicC family protein [Enterococcus villorum]
MKSMTGFGKATRETQEYQLEVEIKSVNQRFLDVQIRSPKALNFLENEIRQFIKQHLSRGRIEVFINLTQIGKNHKQLFIDWPLIDKLVSELTEGIAQRYGKDTQLDIGRLYELLTTNESFVIIEEKVDNDTNELAELVLYTVHEELAEIENSRQKEGSALASILKKNSNELKEVLAQLQQFVDLYEQEYQEKYRKKLEDFLGTSVDQQRLLTELAILLERGDIHEELDRLVIHIQQLDELLLAKQPVGRELDFLIQEMNREINTIGSKSSAIEIKNRVIQLKTILEKIREQIQNIE